MRCAPSAAASSLTLRPRAPSAAKSSTPHQPKTPNPRTLHKQRRAIRSKVPPVSRPPAGNLLTGTLTVADLALSGGGLSQPIQAPKMTLEPVAAPQGSPQALAGTVAIPAGGAVPLTFTVRLSLSGYQVAARGQASFARARQIAHAAGIPQTAALESLAGDPLAVDLTAEGPWIPAEETSLINLSPAQAMNAGLSRRDAALPLPIPSPGP